VIGLLLWTAFSCALEVYRCGWLRWADPWSAAEPSTWRFLSGHVERLDAFLNRIKRHLPAGAAVAVSTEPGPESERLVRTLWVVYLLPEQRVRHARTVADGLAADYWIAYGTRLDHPRLTAVEETWEGALYRVDER
jgi:hypothetical protein